MAERIVYLAIHLTEDIVETTEEAWGIGQGAANHLMDTFNDDGSLTKVEWATTPFDATEPSS